MKNTVMQELFKRFESRFYLNDNRNTWNNIKNYFTLDHKRCDNKLSGRNFILEPLDYYFDKNERLGILEVLYDTHIQNSNGGVYSVYFIVIGHNYFNGDLSYFSSC